MTTEREKPYSRTTILLVEHKEKGKFVYKPLSVNKTADNTITRFILEEKRELEKKLNVSRTTPTRRSMREIRDIRNSREYIDNKKRLSVLRGERLQPIRFTPRIGKIKGFELVSFAQEEQKRWWTFAKQKGQMSKIAEVNKVYPEGLELLSEYFNIRHRMKFGLPKEADQARKEHDSFSQKANKIPAEHNILILTVPLFKMITEKFGD